MGELWRTLTKPSRGLPPTRCVGESGAASSGNQRVVFRVRDLKTVQNVIQMFVPAQLFAKVFDLDRGIFHGPLNYNLTSNMENTPSQPTGIPS
jgi:hypothetical protein